MAETHLSHKFIPDVVKPGVTTGRILALDDRIIVDEYDPAQGALWYCDHCGGRHAVTAQFAIAVDDQQHYVTLCAVCLHLGLNGIAASIARPVSFDDPAADQPGGATR